MGCLPSKPSRNDPFDHPGRSLVSAPPPSQTTPSSQPTRAPVPTKIASQNQGRTLGGGGRGDGGGGGANRGQGGGGEGEGEREDARGAAGRAAEERAAKANTAAKGKIGKELQKERQKTVGEQLVQGSREERRRRDVDGWVGIRGFD